MIALSQVEEIRRLLHGGKLSQRAIARQTGVSRSTVQAIAEQRHSQGLDRGGAGLREGFTPPNGLPVRCPGCGAKVEMPCLACYVRNLKNSTTCRGCGHGEESGTSRRQGRSFAPLRKTLRLG
jgi:hypothetical protein